MICDKCNTYYDWEEYLYDKDLHCFVCPSCKT